MWFHHSLAGYFKNMIASVLYLVHLVNYYLFALVTIESQFDSYEFGAVP